MSVLETYTLSRNLIRKSNKKKPNKYKAEINNHFRTYRLILTANYPFVNEVAKGYSNATVRPSFRNIFVTTLESTSFNGF